MSSMSKEDVLDCFQGLLGTSESKPISNVPVINQEAAKFAAHVSMLSTVKRRMYDQTAKMSRYEARIEILGVEAAMVKARVQELEQNLDKLETLLGAKASEQKKTS